MYLPMAKVPPIVNLSAEDQAQLVRWKSTQGTPQQVALRCRLVLAAAEGYPDLEIASTTKSIDTLSRCGESACKPKGSVRSGRSKRVGGANRSMSWRSGTP